MSDGAALSLGMVYLLICLVSGLTVALMIPRLMPLFTTYALSRPNARSSHRIPTPQGGGVPILASVLSLAGIAGLAGWLAATTVPVFQFYVLLLAGGLAMGLLGTLDDIQPLPATLRLTMQVILTALVVFGAPDEWRLVSGLPLLVERAAVVIAGVWFVNLTNFMDGIDSIVVVEFVPMTAMLALFAALGITSAMGGLIAAALCGALLGFAPFNRHPARLFLGDVGSLSIGLVAAGLLFELATTVSVAAALLLPMYFLFDATETLILGLLARQNVLKAHRRHAYQNAVDGGMPAPDVTYRVGMLNLGLAVLAGFAIVSDEALTDVALLLVGLVATVIVSRQFRSLRP